jgi:peptidoglycan-associated lipoprotein
VQQNKLKWLGLVLALAAALMVSGCAKKKVATAPAPPPPPAAAPTATLTANPNTINAGQASTLSWNTTNATDISIDGLGKVGSGGSTQVLPSESTTYHLVAKGEGGTQEATARITVNPPPAPAALPSNAGDAQLFEQSMKDVLFDYDSYDITGSYTQVLQQDARFLQQHPSIKFTIEGHCDDRGSTEYNLALGDNRALAAKNALISMGIAASRIKTISYGKEKPFCSESTEACWQQNRRDHFVYAQ